MLSERIKVLENQKDKLVIQAIPEAACSSCSARMGCGQSILAKLHPARLLYLNKSALNPELAALKNGSVAHIQLEEAKLLYLSFMFYLLPLFAMLAVTMLASILALSEVLTVIMVLSALFGSIFALKCYWSAQQGLQQEISLARLTNLNNGVSNNV